MVEKKKTELSQELGLQAQDLRFQHVMSIASRNNRIIMRMEVMVSLLAVCKPSFILALGFSCTVLLIEAFCDVQLCLCSSTLQSEYEFTNSTYY